MERVIGPVATRYIPALDGMRAVSIALVLLSHFGFWFIPGLLGVTIFFFISGFLIAGQILVELDGTGRLSLPMFYFRRALRLYPALLVVIVGAELLFLALGGRLSAIDVGAAVFYMANIRETIGAGFLSGLPGVPSAFSVLWSLAVEEHYYLVFPLLALALARRRLAFILLLLGVIAAVNLWRWHVAGACNASGSCFFYRVEHGTDTRIDSILYGAVLAALLASPARAAVMRLMQGWAVAVAGLGLLLLSLVVRDPWFRQTSRFTVQGIGLFLLVGATLFAPSLTWLRAVLGSRPCLLVGRWSYSLYLWHWLVLCAATALLPAGLTRPLLERGFPTVSWTVQVCVPMTLVSLGLAAASYYAVERPMVAIRRRFGSHAEAEAAVARPGPVAPSPT